MKNLNPGVSGLICGIVSNVLNCIMTIAMLLADSFLFGGLFVIVPALGLANSIKSMKLGVGGVMGIIGIILNAIGLLGSLGFVILGFVSKILAVALN